MALPRYHAFREHPDFSDCYCVNPAVRAFVRRWIQESCDDEDENGRGGPKIQASAPKRVDAPTIRRPGCITGGKVINFAKFDVNQLATFSPEDASGDGWVPVLLRSANTTGGATMNPMKPMKLSGLLLAAGLLFVVAPRTASAVSVPGLYGGSKTGTFLTTTWPAVTNIYLRPYPLSTAAQYTYYIYWGKIRLLAGVNSFGLAIDDNEYLKIGGTVVVPLNVGGTYTFTAPATGYYDFELRAGNGSGGSGGSFTINGVNNPADPGDMSLYLHEDGRSAATACSITGTRTATQYGTVSPPYGDYEFPVGTVTNLYVTTGTNYIYQSDTWRVCPSGYVHYAVSTVNAARTLLDSGSSTSYAYTQTELETNLYHEVRWLWREELRIKVAVVGPGTVSTLEAWGNEATPALTLTATPADGYVFYLWTGDVPSASKTSPVVTVDFTQARNIVCYFAKAGSVQGKNAWTGMAGDFRLDNPTNWFNACLPTEIDAVTLSNTVASTYTTATPFSMASLLLVGDGDATFNLNGNTIQLDNFTQELPALFTLTNGTFRQRAMINFNFTVGSAVLPGCRMLVTGATVDGAQTYTKYFRVHPSCALVFTNGAALSLVNAAYFYVYSNAVMNFVDSALTGAYPYPYAEKGSYLFRGLTANTGYFPTFTSASASSSLSIIDCAVGDMWQQGKYFFVGTGNVVTLSGGSRKEWDHQAYWGTGKGCTFNIRDGASLLVDSSFHCGSNYTGTNNVLHMHDGTLDFGRSTSTDTGVAKGITMRLSGTKPVVTCRVPLSAQYTYQFDVPATTNEVWSTAPFRVVANNINVTNSTLVVNARELRQNGGGVVPLFSKSTTGNWGDEINFKKVVLPPGATLLGGQGYKYLSVEIIGPRGLLFLVR